MSETKPTERQQKILNHIKESPTITGKQISETLSVSQRTIERDLSALQKLGILKHEGKDIFRSQNPDSIVFVKDWAERIPFREELFDTCTLYVPSGTRWAYRHHPVFGKFKNIVTE